MTLERTTAEESCGYADLERHAPGEFIDCLHRPLNGHGTNVKTLLGTACCDILHTSVSAVNRPAKRRRGWYVSFDSITRIKETPVEIRTGLRASTYCSIDKLVVVAVEMAAIIPALGSDSHRWPSSVQFPIATVLVCISLSLCSTSDTSSSLCNTITFLQWCHCTARSGKTTPSQRS